MAKRRELLAGALLVILTAIVTLGLSKLVANLQAKKAAAATHQEEPVVTNPLKPPAQGAPRRTSRNLTQPPPSS